MKTSMKFKNMAWAFLRDESGQSTTEYVLLLLFVVIAVKQVGGGLKDRLQKVLDAAFGRVESEVGN